MEPGTLAIQGPPGSGKTYTGAHMIVRLLAAGKRVGITANSHKVIGNFLRQIEDAATEAGVTVNAVQKVTEDEQAVDDERVTISKDNAQVRNGLLTGEFNVGAGTAWLWAPEASEGIVDVLFVDEAGQMSLANALAVSGAAGSIVLLGDPAAARPAAPGLPPARRGPIGVGAPARRARRDAVRSRPLPRAHLATSS